MATQNKTHLLLGVAMQVSSSDLYNFEDMACLLHFLLASCGTLLKVAAVWITEFLPGSLHWTMRKGQHPGETQRLVAKDLGLSALRNRTSMQAWTQALLTYEKTNHVI